MTYLEHNNLTVSNLDASVTFYQTLFPDFRIRGGGTDLYHNDHASTQQSLRWLHLGNQQSYIALQATPDEAPFIQTENHYFNHLGFVVEDLDGCINRIKQLAVEVEIGNEHPFRKRAYLDDPDGNMIELIEYLSEDDSERNDYSDL